MSYYGTLNKQISDYKSDFRKQSKNDIKQMIKYQAFLDQESIDDSVAEKLAKIYSAVHEKVAKVSKNVTKPILDMQTQPTELNDKKRKLTQKVPVIPEELRKYYDMLTTDKQRNKFQYIISSGFTNELSAAHLSDPKKVSSHLSNIINKIKNRASNQTPVLPKIL